MNALLSVSDKAGILEFAQALHGLGIRLLSTGGTAQLLQSHGLPVTEVAEVTGFPEMLDGRVKTLHPKVHGGLLARRDLPEHMAALAAHGIATIDLLVVNLYPFEKTVARAGCTLEEAIENIDIGGPAMVRSAAKNWKDVAVLTDASQYEGVLAELRAQGKVSDRTRFALSVAAFNRISNYDAAISDYLSSLQEDGSRSLFAAQANGRFVKLQDLRYGENPHQQAAFYRDLYPAPGSLVMAQQLQGKELSYNNIADADAAWECVKSFDQCACVIVKHANPCGVATGKHPLEAYGKAFQTDPTSAFGGIIAFNTTVRGEAAQAIAKQFVEVLIAPEFSEDALAVFRNKPNVRLLKIALPPGGASDWDQGRNAVDVKRVGSGLLMQTADNRELTLADLKVVTARQPTPAELQDLLFAWKVAKYVKSNAIVFCKDGMTMGVGAGQMSRLDSARIAGIKAQHAKLSLQGTVVASDAFFPFRDGLDVVVDAGATCVIQPGGSMRDNEVIAAADERGVAMVFSGVRHFRH
ncbi:bifunctional phosphoribosylaminoimidazolecarboxamide formyltransferase/IMP cyclohydrolase [Ramlibacter tataouinensis]|uniref:Bifunctional purine biosynthesis protein PurH n=1 Tax=Ramlibacter tataouinensis (strain ATCC BAA-407 / DSM 14655 / LMG 21543 / TTB310) TaxID=365046 RepID=F5XZI0_RAMTT|nr:bifunctional phosphoribosylaminoimidazolecarboxamide formyltransferase/IMP cyclohydrolase [Ramlibacter tataouinensis]AEG94537.1 candidate bifunctional purine biosynthesis protein : Phosphoribosylaminoimidazolecarboxamide formyltransferase; IMP cyclohydrolase [Ramlibacter tataouinensis TTB310]